LRGIAPDVTPPTMNKPRRTRDQLRIAISTRLALSSACRDGIEVSVFPTDDGGGWNAAGTSFGGTLNAHVDCLRLLKIVVSALQAEFDLAPEPPHSDMARSRPQLEPPRSPTPESFDEVAKKISQVALALRENIAAKPATLPLRSPETAPQRSQESKDHRPKAEHHSHEAEHHREEVQPVTPATIEKVPNLESIYPEEPSGALVAPNHITTDQERAEFTEFSTKVDDLLTLLRETNEFSGEVRDQLIAEILAGRALVGAPKADPILLERFLTTPLKYIAKKSSETAIGELTATMLMLLGKLAS
jgi:hypothetical protein